MQKMNYKYYINSVEIKFEDHAIAKKLAIEKGFYKDLGNFGCLCYGHTDLPGVYKNKIIYKNFIFKFYEVKCAALGNKSKSEIWCKYIRVK